MIRLFSQKNLQKFSVILIFVLFLTPVVFYPALLRPLQTAKFFFFTFFVEVTVLFVVSVFQIEKIIHRLKHPVFIFFTAYIAWVIVSSFFGVDFFNSFFGNSIRTGGWFLLFHVWFFVAVLFLFLNREIFRKAENFFLCVAVVVAVFALLERIGIVPSFQVSHLPRVSSLIGNPIYLAGFLILPLVLALFRSIQTNKREFILYIMAAIIMFGGVLVSGTRGAFLGLIVGLCFGWIYWILTSKQRKRNIMITFFIFILLFGVFGELRAVSKEKTSLYRYTHFEDASISNRLGYWKIALKGFKDYPIMGVGYENFYRAAETYFTPDLYEEEGVFIDKPHNAFLEILVSSGIVGFGLFMCLLWFVARAIIKSNFSQKQIAILFGGFIAFEIQNVFVFDTIAPLFAFAFFLAWVMRFCETNNSDEGELPAVRERKSSVIVSVFSVAIIGYMLWQFFIPSFQYFLILKGSQNAQIPQIGFLTLERHRKLSFVFDRFALAKRYEVSAQHMIGLEPFDTSLFVKFIQAGSEQYLISTKQHPLRAEHWYRLASIGLMSDLAYRSVSHETISRAIEQAIRLASVRVEPFIAKAYQLNLEGKTADAITLLNDTYKRVPNSPKLLWSMAAMYYQLGQIDTAADFGWRAIKQGISLSQAQTILWLADYFAQKQDFNKVVDVYEKAVAIEPGNVSLLPNLLASYMENGQTNKAIQIAEQIIEKDPEHALSAREFISKIKSQVK